MIEAFHIFFKRALVALLRQTELALDRILPTLLLAYRSTPHIATGETPFYLMTAMDMCIPGMQEWTPVALPDEPGGRLDTLCQIRREVFDKMARVAVEQEEKKKRRCPDLTLLAPGSLVLYWLSPEERKGLFNECGGPAAVPLWSGPCCVMRKVKTEADTYAIQHLWERAKTKVYRMERLVPIPRNWGAEELYASLLELLADLTRPTVRCRSRRRRPRPGLDGVPLQQRQQAVERMNQVERELESRMREEDLLTNDDEDAGDEMEWRH